MVRDARPDDAHAIEQVRIDGWRGAYSGILAAGLLANLVVEEERVAALRSALTHPEPHEINLVAEQEGVVLAMARLSRCRDDDARVDDVAELRALYVAPGSWSNGLGSRLLDEGFARMEQTLQVLWTLEGNSRARAFYERRGFVLDGARRTRELIGAAVEVRYRRRRPVAVAADS